MGFQTNSGTFTTAQFKRFFTDLTRGKDILGKFPEIIYAIKNSFIYFAVNIFICTPLVIFFSYDSSNISFNVLAIYTSQHFQF